LLNTRFAGMPQALWAALREDGHEVIRPETCRSAAGHVGDRGLSSLSWATLTAASRWG
jgi:hypothetical protein